MGDKPPELTEAAGRRALRDHVAARAAEARALCGGRVDASACLRMLDDRAVVRYATGLRFDAAGLEPGEFAHAQPLGDHPRQGFCLFIHPQFESRPELWPLLIAYHIVDINYGDVATAAEAELFGSTLLGMEVDAYYETLCALADSITPPATDGDRSCVTS